MATSVTQGHGCERTMQCSQVEQVSRANARDIQDRQYGQRRRRRGASCASCAGAGGAGPSPPAATRSACAGDANVLSTAPRWPGSRIGERRPPGGSACGLSCHGVAGPGQRAGVLSPTAPLVGRPAGMLSPSSLFSTTACTGVRRCHTRQFVFCHGNNSPAAASTRRRLDDMSGENESELAGLSTSPKHAPMLHYESQQVCTSCMRPCKQFIQSSKVSVPN